MRVIKSRNYKIGEDTIFTDYCKSENSFMIAGDVKVDGKYKILLVNIDKSGNELWTRVCGAGHEYEAQTILESDDKCIVGGNAHGRATESGGHGWKAYILSVNKSGEKLKEMTYKIGNNDVIYTMINRGDELWAMGESRSKEPSVFTMRINKELELLETKNYGRYDDVLAGAITSKFLTYSYKRLNKWFARIIRVDEELNKIWERHISELMIYSSIELGNSLLVVGTKGDNGIALKVGEHSEKEVQFEDSAVLGAATRDELVILAGEHRKRPVLYLLNYDLELLGKFVARFEGWYEKAFFTDSGEIIAMGYSQAKNMGVVSVITQ